MFLVRTTLSVSLTVIHCLISIEGLTVNWQTSSNIKIIKVHGRKFTCVFNMTMHTLYIKEYCCCVRSSYRIAGCTAVRPWTSPLYVKDGVFRSIVKRSSWTVRPDPFPRDACVWIGSRNCAHQYDCISLNQSVWIWCIRFHLWFICFNLSIPSYLFINLHLLHCFWTIS